MKIDIKKPCSYSSTIAEQDLASGVGAKQLPTTRIPLKKNVWMMAAAAALIAVPLGGLGFSSLTSQAAEANGAGNTAEAIAEKDSSTTSEFTNTTDTPASVKKNATAQDAAQSDAKATTDATATGSAVEPTTTPAQPTVQDNGATVDSGQSYGGGESDYGYSGGGEGEYVSSTTTSTTTTTTNGKGETLSGNRPSNFAPANNMNSQESLLARDIFNSYNDYRASKGLPRLQWSDDCANMAYACSTGCSSQGKLVHGLGLGGNDDYYSDILQYSSWKKTGAECVDSWAGSNGHRKMMQCDNATMAGVGVYQNASGTWYYTIVYDWDTSNQSGC